MMLSSKMAAQIGQQLDASDFYRPAHQTIFKALRRLSLGQTTVDMVTLPNALGKELEAVGGEVYLFECMEATPAASSGPHYAKTVQDLAALRRLEAGAMDILGMARDESMDVTEKVSRSAQIIGSVRTSESAYRSVAETIFDLPKSKRECLSLPWQGLNDLTTYGGLTVGEPHAFMADTGGGKTYIGTQLARHWCKQGRMVGYMSLELSREDLQSRIMFQETGFWNEDHASHFGMLDRFVEKQREIATWGLQISDYSRSRIQDIHLEGIVCDMEAAHAAQRFDVVIVDYMQLLKPKKYLKPFEALAEAAHTLKWVAKTGKFAILELLQAKQKDGGELLERGSLEIRDTLATLVCLERKEKSKTDPGYSRFRPIKMRHGAKSVVELEFTNRFEFVEASQQTTIEREWKVSD